MIADVLKRIRDIQSKDANQTFSQATDSLEAIADALAAGAQGLAYYGVVTAVPGVNQFTVPTLAGRGETAFVNWTAFIFWDAGGAAAAPQGESQLVTAYVSATGDFTTAAFTAAVAAGDIVLILHPSLAGVIAALAVPAVGAATNVYERDVIGNKGDQPNFNTDNASIVFSLMSWLRGIARAKIQISGAAQAGSDASNIVDALSLTSAAGFWIGQHVLMLSGANQWLVRPIVAFNDVTDTITVSPAFPAAVGVGDTYIILGDYQDPLPGADGLINLLPAQVPGNKADTALYAATATASLMRYVKGLLGVNVLAVGTFTTSSTTVPADTGRAEASGHWDGCILMPLAGADAFQPRQISTFTTGTGVFTLNSTTPFTAVPGLVAYAILPAIAAASSPTAKGVTQVFQVAVTSAANAGAVTLATLTDQGCILEMIIIKAVSASQTDLTSAAVTGGAAGIVVFFSVVDAAKANIDAVDEQIFWQGSVELAATKTIVMNLVGTGATPVDLLVTFVYRAVADGGYLA